MFPGRFQGGLDDDFSDLPLVKEPETDVAPERIGGTRLDLHRRQGTALTKAVDLRVSVLQRGHRPDGQRPKWKSYPPLIKVLNSAPSVLPEASPCRAERPEL